MRATPLQMAMVAAGVANRGVVMQPYLVQSVIGSDLSVIESADPQELSQAVTPEVAEQLTRHDGVGRRGRHGHGARRSRASTWRARPGTAQHGEGRKAHAWFISFAPADDPEIAVAVIAEDGGIAGSEAGGGTVAAPIAKQMMEARLDQ